MIRLPLLFLIIISLCIPVGFTNALTEAELNTVISEASSLKATDIALGINPENPTPNSTVIATIESYATDLDASLITWYVNGKKVDEGKGIKKIQMIITKNFFN